ncbi:hypothetical protein [Azospirillum argentinense]|uniref:hypothetical protein n=1 Tax=Azospirillum argentinense TaxID=2970906 RepID=UPI0032DFF75A
MDLTTTDIRIDAETFATLRSALCAYGYDEAEYENDGNFWVTERGVIVGVYAIETAEDGVVYRLLDAEGTPHNERYSTIVAAAKALGAALDREIESVKNDAAFTARVSVSARNIRLLDGCDSDAAVEAIADAVREAAEDWAKASGYDITIEVDTLDDGVRLEADGDDAVEVVSDLARELRTELEHVVSEAEAKAIGMDAWED